MSGLTPIVILTPGPCTAVGGTSERRGRSGRERPRPARSAGLAVLGVLAAVRAELGEREPVGVVAPVLLRDVVPVPAHRASHRDLGSHVLRLAGHGAAFSRVEAAVRARGAPRERPEQTPPRAPGFRG